LRGAFSCAENSTLDIKCCSQNNKPSMTTIILGS
jgi:hypothetical protein